MYVMLVLTNSKRTTLRETKFRLSLLFQYTCAILSKHTKEHSDMTRIIVFVFALLSAINVQASGTNVVVNNGSGVSLYTACAQSTSIGGSTYTFNNATEGACSVAPPPPAGNYVRGVVRYDGPAGHSYQVDFSELGNLFGRAPNAATNAYPTWPYASGSQPTLIQAPKGAIVRSRFHTPATVAPVTFRGPYQALQPVVITVTGNVSGVCTATIRPNGADQFTITAATNNLSKCIVQPDSDYVFQMTAPACTAAVCAVGLQSNH